MSVPLYDLRLLRSYCWLKQDLKRCPTKHEFMEKRGVSSTSLNKFFKRLKDYGFFVVYPFNEDAGATVVNIYCRRPGLVKTKVIGFKILGELVWTRN